MQRTFIAIKVIPEKEMTDCILHLQDALRKEKIKWVDPGKLHITLRFLGDTGPSQVSSIIKIVEETVPEFEAPVVEFRGLGLFRSIRDPKVIWMGMDPGPILPNLKTRMDQRLLPLGFAPEDRRFRPHLTLGRIKFLSDRGILEDLLEEYRNMRFQKNLIKELIYYESILRPAGPGYLMLKTICFKNV